MGPWQMFVIFTGIRPPPVQVFVHANDHHKNEVLMQCNSHTIMMQYLPKLRIDPGSIWMKCMRGENERKHRCQVCGYRRITRSHSPLLWEHAFLYRKLKGWQLDAFWHRPYCTLTLNSNFAISKTLKSFSIRVNELFEPIVLRRKGDGCLLFLKAFSWETDLWVTQ